MVKSPSFEKRETSIGRKTRELTPSLTRSKAVLNTKWTRNLKLKELSQKISSKKNMPRITKCDAHAESTSWEAQSAPIVTDPHKMELLQILEQMRDLN